PCATDAGANEVLTNMVRRVAERLGSSAPLVLITDTAEVTSTDWLPPGVRLYTLDSLHPGLSLQDKELVLVRLILQACPVTVNNINSGVGWNLYKSFGRQLATAGHLIAWLFDYDYDSDNVPGGFPVQHLNQCIENLSCLFADSQRFCNDLIDRFAFGETDSKKILVIPTQEPIDVNGLPTACGSPRKQDVLAARRPCASTEPQFDISLVINAHTEGRLLHPTVRSALNAIEYASGDSLSVVLLIVLDRPDPATREYCPRYLAPQARVLEVSVKDPGLARNAGVEAAGGRYTAFLDGDDLFGRNWLLAAYRAISADTRELVLHPSLI